MDLTPFKNMIQDRCGFSFDENREAALTRIILDRMPENSIKSDTEYLSFLCRNQDELQRLINLLTVNETYFFREPAHLKLFSERLVPELLRKRGNGVTLRILSAGCSTGEEPYSLGMELAEKYGEANQNLFSITGVDVDSEAIRIAKNGIFSRGSFRDFEDRLKKKYFEKADKNHYKLKRIIKDRVTFHNFNLLSDSYPNMLRNMDFIFYRNVSIYFEAKIQEKVFRKLFQIVNDGGYILLSSTETLSHDLSLLPLIEVDGMFLYKKGGRPNRCDTVKSTPDIKAQHFANASSKSNSELSQSPGSKYSSNRKSNVPAIQKDISDKISSHEELFDEALLLGKKKQYDNALKTLYELIEDDPSFTKAYLLQVSILINLNQLEKAERICLKIIEMDQFCREAYLLSGLIAKLRSDEEDALKKFKKALYIKPSCWVAHFYSAEIYRSCGEMEPAIREYGIVVKLFEKGEISDHGLTLFPFSFTQEQMIHLCRYNLSDMKRKE